MSVEAGPFYDAYARFKVYARPSLAAKHIKRLDRDLWRPGDFAATMSVLEVGCGTGLVLAYLRHRGIRDLLGIDRDPALVAHIPEAVVDCFRVADLWDFLADGGADRRFDRVLLLDVLEHFEPRDGLALLRGLGDILTEQGRIVVKVPNMASPWGAAYQYGDLTHKAAYTPDSLRQVAIVAGLAVERCWPHREGSPPRQVTDRLFHALLGRLVASPPEIWTANLFALLARAPVADEAP